MSSTPHPDDRPVTLSSRQRYLAIDGDTVTSHSLLGNTGLLVIEHNGRCYQLRRTRNDRLILTS
nr:hemin uptake protein HemP [Halomonas halocynthiae]